MTRTTKLIYGPAPLAGLDYPAPEIEHLLAYTLRQYSAHDGPTGYTHSDTEVDLSHPTRASQVIFPPGLIPRIHMALREAGYQVEIEDLREPSPRFVVDEDHVARLGGSQRAIVAAVAREHLGQIEVRGPSDAAKVAARICRAFPRARILLATATKRAAWRLWHHLQPRLHEPIGLRAGNTRHPGGRLLVSTFALLPGDTDGEWDALIVPRGEDAVTESAIHHYRRIVFPRVYAFVDPHRRPDVHDDLRLVCLAGPVIHTLCPSRVPTRVVLVPGPGRPPRTWGSPLERKRALYWHHKERNELIATLARALVAGDDTVLCRHGLAADAARRTSTGTPRVAILVESLEHGRRLARLPPGWALSALPTFDGPLPQKHPRGAPQIVTMSYAAIRRVRADILIRASGGDGPLDVRGFPARAGVTGAREALVVDLLDAHAPIAAAVSRCRMRDYARLGYPITVGKPTESNPRTTARNSSSVRRSDAPSALEVGRALAGPAIRVSYRVPSRSFGGR
jgi:hypothetical protein